MLILAALMLMMIAVIAMGKLIWQKKSAVYVIAGLIALLQTLFVLYEMFTKKMPMNL